jgi:hypothetical protein
MARPLGAALLAPLGLGGGGNAWAGKCGCRDAPCLSRRPRAARGLGQEAPREGRSLKYRASCGRCVGRCCSRYWRGAGAVPASSTRSSCTRTLAAATATTTSRYRLMPAAIAALAAAVVTRRRVDHRAALLLVDHRVVLRVERVRGLGRDGAATAGARSWLCSSRGRPRGLPTTTRKHVRERMGAGERERELWSHRTRAIIHALPRVVRHDHLARGYAPGRRCPSPCDLRTVPTRAQSTNLCFRRGKDT